MKKDIKDYLHFYIGCEVHESYNDRIATLVGIALKKDHPVICINKDVYWHFLYSEIKPILRPLSDMNDEEMKVAHEIYYTDKIELLAILDVAHFELYRYLLSRGFDLFGLIESGLALDKTKM